MSWPADADGDVFRRLEAAGFDFSRPCEIDFNVDFANWPPDLEAITLLVRDHPSTRIIQPDAAGAGYAQFQVNGLLQYDTVIRIQTETTVAMKPFGGICESWGVMQD